MTFTRNHLILTGILSLFSSILSAQTLQPCGTDEERKKLLVDHPEILEREANFDKLAAKKFAEIAKIEGDKLIIPVVFHVVHDYGPENISDAQIFDAMEHINADFSATNADFGATIAEFAGIAANCEIEFRLAQRELSGACTNGITRHASMRTYEGSDAAKLGGWQSGKYLNIWVVKDLTNGAAAYAYYPTSIEGLMYTVDGVICRYDYVGTIGAAGSYASHVLSHEIGHYLNLQHVWGNNNAPGVACGDDQVPDTPMTEGWTSCNIYGNTCSGPIDNVQNHMEYSYCSTMFSEGQKSRMYAALESDDAMRNNLPTEENLILTGTVDGYVSSPCAPVADFYASQRYICSGESVTYHDVSYNGEVTSRMWTFEGGSPATSTDIAPVVTYTEEGWHKVTLSVSNGVGVDVKEWDNYLHIAPATATYDHTYFEHFNNEAQVMNDWVLYNKYEDNYEWKWRGANGYYNTGCIWLNSRFGPNLESDVAISPAFDLSSGLTDNLFFKYATTSYGNSEDDYTMSLKVYYSINCGDSWIYMNKVTGADLITSYGGSSDFYPQYPDQWGSAAFNLPEACKTDHVQFKLEFLYNYYVNNVFVDDFNFTSGVLSASENTPAVAVKVYPNPVSGSGTTTVHYSMQQPGNVAISVCDLTGRSIKLLVNEKQQEGSHSMQVCPSALGLSSGCYFIRIEAGEQVVSDKLVVLQ